MIFVCIIFCNSVMHEVMHNFNYRLSTEAQEFFTSYDEVHETFDAMGLQENLLRGIYAYGIQMTFHFFFKHLLSMHDNSVTPIRTSHNLLIIPPKI